MNNADRNSINYLDDDLYEINIDRATSTNNAQQSNANDWIIKFSKKKDDDETIASF